MGRTKRDRSKGVILKASSPSLQNLYAWAQSIESNSSAASSTEDAPIPTSPSLECFVSEYSTIKVTLLSKEHINIAKAIDSLASLIEKIEEHPEKKNLNSNLIQCYYLKAACIFYLETWSAYRSVKNRNEAYRSITNAKELGFEVPETLWNFMRVLKYYSGHHKINLRKLACENSYMHRVMITKDYFKNEFPKQAEAILDEALESPSPSYISPNF